MRGMAVVRVGGMSARHRVGVSGTEGGKRGMGVRDESPKTESV
jgi:hypothetical protein